MARQWSAVAQSMPIDRDDWSLSEDIIFAVSVAVIEGCCKTILMNLKVNDAAKAKSYHELTER